MWTERGGRAAIWLLLMALALPSAAQAQLAWTETRLQLDPPAGAHESTAVFTMTNRGERLVRITDVQTGCGCTVPDLERTELKPGEQGTLRAIYHPGLRQGRQSVTISVFTDEGRSQPYELALDVVIKPTVGIAPRLVYWRLGDEPEARSVDVTLVEDYRLLGVESSSPDFTAELVAGEGMRRIVRVVPRDTIARRQAQITVRVARGEAEPETVVFWARVL